MCEQFKFKEQLELLHCDYLVVGAGTSGMSFVDTMLTEHPTATIILVDRNSRPGGHWTQAYPFVRLHQPSCYYGVNSLRLGKKQDSKGNERYDVNDRATGAEILEYFQKACDNFVASGRVRCCFDSEHSLDETTGEHTIRRTRTTTNGNESDGVFSVTCRKLVTIENNVTVPSMREPLIPVHHGVSFVPLNDIASRSETGNYRNYIVFGNGKSGVDAITHLVLEKGVDPCNITWIVSRDVWYVLRESLQDFYRINAIFGELFAQPSAKGFVLGLEANGVFVRIDPNRPYPRVFKGATVDRTELDAVRSIRAVVRMGRATAVESDRIVLDQGSLSFSPSDTLLVDCMVDNFYGYSFEETFRIFEPGRIHLGPGMAFFNPSFTAAIVAFLECSIGGENENDRKNDCCYFVRGKHSEPTPEIVVGANYMETKVLDSLLKLKGGSRFLFGSRTWKGNPIHHKGGLRRFLWELYGPHQLHKVGPRAIRKLESKGFSDIDHCFGVEDLVKDQMQRKYSETGGRQPEHSKKGSDRRRKGFFRNRFVRKRSVG
jgi:hypothetical protein